MTHFMVLREDLLTPLREGIAAFRAGTLDTDTKGSMQLYAACHAHARPP